MRRASSRSVLVRRIATLGGGYAAALVLIVVVNILRPGFASPDNLASLSKAATVLGIAAAGQTLVILIGGFDLSVPALMTAAATALTLAAAAGIPVWSAIAIVLVACAAVGALNGLGVGVFGVSSVIMTLGMGSIVAGGLLAATGGAPAGAAPEALVAFINGRGFGLPGAVIVWLVVTAALVVMLSFTKLGRRLYAVGTSPTVALFSGIRVGSATIVVYAIASALAGLAGIVLVGWVGQPSLGMGDPYLFSTVAAVAIGGTSILGGTGHYVGTVGGALALTVLTALLPVFNLDQWAQNVLFGLVVLLAVVVLPRAEEQR